MGWDVKREKKTGQFRNNIQQKYDLTFKSNIELFAYEYAKKIKLKCKFQPWYNINPGFDYMDEHIRPLSVNPDFEIMVGDVINVVDTKGEKKNKKTGLMEAWILPDSALKYKLLKYHFYVEKKKAIIHFPFTESMVEKLFDELKKMKDES